MHGIYAKYSTDAYRFPGTCKFNRNASKRKWKHKTQKSISLTQIMYTTFGMWNEKTVRWKTFRAQCYFQIICLIYFSFFVILCSVSHLRCCANEIKNKKQIFSAKYWCNFNWHRKIKKLSQNNWWQFFIGTCIGIYTYSYTHTLTLILLEILNVGEMVVSGIWIAHTTMINHHYNAIDVNIVCKI